MDEAEKRRLELEAEAEAEAEYEYLQSQKTTAPETPKPGFLEGEWNAVKQGASNLWEGMKRIPEELVSASRLNPGIPLPVALVSEKAKSLYQHPETIAPTLAGLSAAGIGMATGNLGGFASYPLLNQAAHKVNEYLGYEKPQTAEDALHNLTSDITSAGLATGASMLPGMIKGGVQSVKDKFLGLPEENRLALRAERPDAYVNTLGGERTVGAGETKLVQQADNYKNAFTRTNPVEGIDNSLPGTQQFEQLKNNLQRVEIDAIKSRKGILQNVANAESAKLNAAQSANAPIKVGVAFEDIPPAVVNPNGTTFGINSIAREHPSAIPEINAAVDYVKQQFGIAPAVMHEGTAAVKVPASPGRALTATELESAIKAVDDQIEALKGYDLTRPDPNINPSKINAGLSTYQFMRGQLSKALNSHIENLVGPEAATQFSRAGENIGMAKNTSMLANRFQTETGQAFTPNLPKQDVPGVTGKGLINSTLETLAPDAATARMQTRALTREPNAIRELQALVDFNRGLRPQPLPRSWALIKTSAQNMNALGAAAISLGILPSHQPLTELPDEAAKKVTAMVAQVQPQLFEPNEDKINVIDGEFQDPIGKDIIVRQSLEASPEERALRIGATFKNKYIPKTQTPPISRALPALPVTLDRVNSSLASGLKDKAPAPPSQDSSYDQSHIRMLEQLTNSELLNSGGYN